MVRISHLVTALAALTPLTGAEKLLESTSLNPCMVNSKFSATLFNVAFRPDKQTLSFNINGVSAISGHVTAELNIIAYGLNIYKKVINPCDEKDFDGLCPMNTGDIKLNSSTTLPASTVKQIPGLWCHENI